MLRVLRDQYPGLHQLLLNQLRDDLGKHSHDRSGAEDQSWLHRCAKSKFHHLDYDHQQGHLRLHQHRVRQAS